MMRWTWDVPQWPVNTKGQWWQSLLVTGFLAFPQEIGTELPPVMLGPSP